MANTEENKKTVSNFVKAIEKKDFNKVKEFFTGDHTFNFPMSPTPLNGQGHIETLKSLFTGFPDLTHKIENQIAENDKVATRGRITGTHKGEFQGVPASGKKIDISWTEIHRVKDGKIAEEWAQMDTAGMMQQIGAMP